MSNTRQKAQLQRFVDLRGAEIEGVFDPDWYTSKYPDVLSHPGGALDHFLTRGIAENRSPTPLFSGDWYSERYGPLGKWDGLPFVHFMTVGWEARNDPSEFFSVSGYLEEHPEAAPPATHPLLDFLSRFDARWYVACYQDVAATGLPAAYHYLKFGRFEGRLAREPAPTDQPSPAVPQEGEPDPSSPASPMLEASATAAPDAAPPVPDWFDPAWYRSEYPDLDYAHQTPFEHFEAEGRAQGRHPRFDEAFYLQEYPELADSGLSARDHYDRIGRLQCRHPAFNAAWYCEYYKDVGRSGVDPYAHYRRHGVREGRHPAFNQVWYLDQNRDVADASLDPYAHFAGNGSGEGREPAFHRQWYATEYPDVATSGLDPYDHFKQSGKAEGRLPSGYSLPTVYKVRVEGIPKPFTSELQARGNFAGLNTDIKAVAFYLPQFHQSAYNDKFWGFGFTEWTNVRGAMPAFPNHYQPRVPHDSIGYYDLANPETLRNQADLARSFGIHGFCMYHYWFSGVRVLEKPVDLLIANKDIDTNFCLCWANENWTRAWDGMETDVLLRQEYKPEDPERFIADIAKYFRDPRYIRVDGKPLLLVYKAQVIPDVASVFQAWRDIWRRMSNEDLYIACVQTDPNDRNYTHLPARFDALVSFPPHVVPASRHQFHYMMDNEYCGVDQSGHLFDYGHLVTDIVSAPDTPPAHTASFLSVMLAWDNAARRKSGWSVWYGFSLGLYYAWLVKIIASTRANLPPDRRFVFINAWNEWAEGTVLEPDRATGFSSLNVTARALYGLPLQQLPKFVQTTPEAYKNDKRVAVHFHLYFESLLEESLGYLNNIPYDFDLYVTTDTDAKAAAIYEAFNAKGTQKKLFVERVPNIGRDVAPFLVHVLGRLRSYDYIGHFHTKRSLTVDWGDHWRAYLLRNLLGSTQTVQEIFSEFERDPELGIVCPPVYPLIEPHLSWGDVQGRCTDLLRSMGLDMALPEVPTFPAGNMFWARSAALRPLLSHVWKPSDFEHEDAQVGGTLAHCVERLWCYIVAAGGYRSEMCFGGAPRTQGPGAPAISPPQPRRLCIFVHYDAHDTVSEADLFMIRALNTVTDEIIVVSNSRLTNDSVDVLRLYASDVIVRENLGYDFLAWKTGLLSKGFDKLARYDEIVFANNSCFGPFYPMDRIMAEMSARSCDFWGLSDFPLSENSPRPEAQQLPGRTIAYHLQTYFFVTKARAVASSAFRAFWEGVVAKDELIDVVTSYETRFTADLSAAGLQAGCYVPEAATLQKAREDDPRFNLPYNQPLSMLLLGCPLVKKKAFGYAPEEMHKVRSIANAMGVPPHFIRPG